MSLLGTLAKIAVGVAVAKGVSGMLNKGSGSSGGAGQQGGGLGSLLEQLGGGSQKAGTQSAGQSSGGLGDLLGNLTGGAGGGGLGDLLGGAGGGGLGDLLGGLAGKAPQQRDSGGSFGDLLNGALETGREPEVQPSASEEAIAGLMLRATIQAAKSDGTLDDSERARLMDNLEDASPEEIEFVNREFMAPIDVDGLAKQVPEGMEQQVYAMSVMGIKLDDQAEAEYLHKLAGALKVGQAEVNNIHDQLGAPRIYS